MLARLIATAVAAEGPEVCITVSLRECWVPPWPRPMTLAIKADGVTIRSRNNGGCFDWSELGQLLEGNPRYQPAKKWWTEVKDVCDERARCSTQCFLKQVVAKPSLKALFLQIIMPVSHLLEKVLGLSAQGKLPHGLDGFPSPSTSRASCWTPPGGTTGCSSM